VDGDKTVNHNTVPGSFVGSVGYSEKIYHENTTGRFPANLLVSDDMLNDGVVSKSEGRKIYENEDININNNVYNDGWKRQKSDIKDKGTNSRYYDIDRWFDNLIK
jgi:hypothetical protein